jgi:glucosylceramidase
MLLMFVCFSAVGNGQWVRAAASLPQSNLHGIVTSADHKLSNVPAVSFKEVAGVPGQTISIEPEKKFQSMLGFGGAFTDAACYTFNRMPAADRDKLLREFFDPGQLNFAVCRTCIGSSDYSTHVYSYDEGDADPEMKRFSVDEDRKYVIPVIRQARSINPDLFLFSTPWSPPGWMKPNKSMLGGCMERQFLKPYAKYFLHFLKDYQAAGVPIQAVTVQNEVDTDQDSRMPACAWPQELEVDFVRGELGPLLEKEGMKTQIWIIDHNYNLWGRAMASLDEKDLRKYASAVAWHGYLGSAERMSDVHNAYPDVDMYWTEGGPDYTDKEYATNWVKWSKTFTANCRNWCRASVAWNLALDEEGKPNLGPFPCGGVVTVNSKTNEVTRSGQYYALAHFSKFVKRGARRIESKGDVPDVAHVAFENPNGEHVAVITNAGAARTVYLQASGKNAALQLEPDSVTTVVWN